VGIRLLHLFGLIVLLVFAIIVIVWVAEGLRTTKKGAGGVSMGNIEEGKTVDIISEIDREISDIFEEMGGTGREEKPMEEKLMEEKPMEEKLMEEKPVAEKPAIEEKKPEDRWSELEKDGIIIKK
jgi:hypothetical protein